MHKNILASTYLGVSRRTFMQMIGAAGIALAGYSFIVKHASAGEATAIKDLQQGERKI